jgi:hypothetical protein
MHTMTEKKGKSGTIDVKALMAGDEEFLRALVRTALRAAGGMRQARSRGEFFRSIKKRGAEGRSFAAFSGGREAE